MTLLRLVNKEEVLKTIDSIPEIFDNIRTERKLELINFIDPNSEPVEPQKDSKQKEAKKDLMKFKNKEEEAEYIEETNKLTFNSIKENIQNNFFKLEDMRNFFVFKENLKLSEELPCLEILDKIKRKRIISEINVESKRVLMHFTLNFKNNLPDSNPINPNDYIDFVKVRFKNCLDFNNQEIIFPDLKEETPEEVEEEDNEEEKVNEQNNDKINPEEVKKEEPVEEKKEEGQHDLDDLLNLDKKEEENKEPELSLADIQQEDLQVLLNSLYILTSKYPKYVLLLITLKQPNGKIVSNNTDFLFEYLNTELETQVVAERGPIIEDFNEKIENEDYEESSVIFIKNYPEFDFYSNEFNDKNNIKRVNLWTPQKLEVERFSRYYDIYIKDRNDGDIWSYNPLHALLTVPKYIGSELAKGIEFIKKSGPNYNEFKNKDCWPKSIVFLGGEFDFRKIEFLIKFINFFDEFVLIGKMGLLFIFSENDFEQNDISLDIRRAVVLTKQKIADYLHKVKVANRYVLIEEEESIEKFFNLNEPYSEDYIKTQEAIYDKNENYFSLVDVEEEFVDLKQIEEVEFKTNGLIEVSPLFIDSIVNTFDEFELIWFIDSFSLNSCPKLKLADDILLESLNVKYGFFETDNINLSIKSKISILGSELIDKLNSFNFSKKKLIKAKIQRKQEKQKNKIVKFNTNTNNESEEEDDEESEDFEDLSESERSNDEEINQNVMLISNNFYKNSKYVLDLLNCRASEGNLISYREL